MTDIMRGLLDAKIAFPSPKWFSTMRGCQGAMMKTIEILDRNAAVACSRCLMQQMMNLDKDLHEKPQASVRVGENFPRNYLDISMPKYTNKTEATKTCVH